MASATNVRSVAGSVGRRLSRAPLARVLCQIRWQQLSRFDLDAVADEVAHIVGGEYPLRDAQHEIDFVFSPSGVSQQNVGMIHRFQSVDRAWTLSLSSQFLALETSVYEGHVGFIDRLERSVAALTEAARIPFLTRIGYRYTNRLTNPSDITGLRALVVEGVLGGLAQGDAARLTRTVSESLYTGDEGTFLLVRSALLEPGMEVEPGLPPTDGKSWILDLDAFREEPAGLPVDTVVQQATELSARAADHFWSVVTDEFIRRFE